MNRVTLELGRAIFMAALVLLSACNGGGDNTPLVNAASRTAGPESVAATAVSMVNLSSISQTAASSITFAVKPEVRSHFSLIQLGKRLFNHAQDSAPVSVSALASGIVVDLGTTPCAVSGSRQVSFDDVDNSASFTSGDQATISMLNCDDGDGSVVNGSVTFSGNWVGTPSVSGSIWSMILTMTFTDVVAIEGSDRQTLNGSVSLSGHSDGSVESYSVTFSNLVITESGVRFSSNQLKTVSTLDLTTNEESVTVDGDLSSSVDGGLVIKTLSPIVTPQGATVPTSGSINLLQPNGLSVT
ncbi:MAG: hypothetical protein D6698_01320, partial [Gammaproteobacteria bacterium]